MLHPSTERVADMFLSGLNDTLEALLTSSS